MTKQVIGGLWMAASAIAYSLHLSIVKLVTSSINVLEVGCIRNVIAAIILFSAYAADGMRTPSSWRLYAVRSILGVSCIMCLYYANSREILAVVVVLFTSRIFLIAAISPMILGESVSKQRWLGIAVGFAGVVITMWPSDFSWPSVGAIAALTAAALSAGSQIAVKALVSQNSPLTVSGISACLFAILSVPVAWPVWTPPEFYDIYLIGCAAIFSALATFFAAKSLSYAPISAVSPVDNSNIIVASIIAFFAFGEIPELRTIVGSALIVWAASYVVKVT